MWTDEYIRKRNEEIFGKGTMEATRLEVPLVKKPRMNKWESEYARELEFLSLAGKISWWAFEPMKLRLADKTYYTPDFAVVQGGVLEFVEVKGFWRDDARVKFKVAAEKFPFTFRAIRKRKVSEGGGWELVDLIVGGGT